MSKINMKKTFILNKGSHVEIDIAEKNGNTTVLTINFENTYCEESQGKKNLPVELTSTDANRMWNICMENKWIDMEYQPIVSQKRAAIIASVIADELSLSPKWAAFEKLWNMPNMATKLSQAQCCRYYSDFIRIVEDAIV